jgi:hypothetical protein
MTITLPEGTRIHHATLAKANALDAMFAAEYPNLRLIPVITDDSGVGKVTGWDVTTAMGDAINEETYAKVPALADVLDAAAEADIDPTEGEEDEDEKRGGSVVPEHYRARYRESSSNGQTCGDWLAEFLVANTHSVDGFNVADFEAILSENAVDLTAKWATVARNPGWVGRFRMNGRQVLEKIVARTGKIKAHGAETEAPAEAVAILREKHKNWIAKMEKAEAKAATEAKAVTAEAE